MREKVRDIKVLDKSSAVGQRMKNAFIRTKKQAEAQQNESNATPEAYAEEHIEHAAQRGVTQIVKAPKRIKTRDNAEMVQPQTHATKDNIHCPTDPKCEALLQTVRRDTK